MAGVGGYYSIAPADRIICLSDPNGAEGVTNGAVQTAATLEEEATVPINRQAQAKPDGVGLAVLAHALIDFADDLAVRGSRRISRGRIRLRERDRGVRDWRLIKLAAGVYARGGKLLGKRNHGEQARREQDQRENEKMTHGEFSFRVSGVSRR
jgi:hypothetical protein